MVKDRIEHEWKARMYNAMILAHPEYSEDDIKRVINKTYKERFKDTEAKVYDNYENRVSNTTLSEAIDWMTNKKPLITESGVFFYQKSEKENINVKIIKECMLDARKIHKKEKFKAMEAGDVFLAAVKDIQQANDKKAANSGYGAEGEASSFLFNIHSAMSVTASGRGQISTACQCFENLFSDNVLFFEMTEFYNWLYNIMNEKDEWKYNTFDICDVVPSREQFVDRIKRKFGHPTLYNEEEISNIYDSLDEEMIIRVYYKNNLNEFLLLDVPSSIYEDIADSKVEFIDPNSIPSEIEDYVHELSSMVIEFVGYKYSVFRYEDRTKYLERKSVITIDTDSNFVCYYNNLKHVMNNVLYQRLFRSQKKYDIFKLRVLNVLSVFASDMIGKTLFNYLGHCNVPEEDRPHINMKNEFYNSILMTTFAKKSYMALQRRQENIIFDPPNPDVKGVNFFKSTSTAKTSEFINEEILMNELFMPKDGNISLKRIYKKINDFQQMITKEIKSGDVGYLKQSIKVKTADGYSKPMSIGQYKAVYVWNKICDDKETIKLPATVTIVKVLLRNKQDLVALEQWPKIYKKFEKLFDTDPEIGDFIDQTDGKLKKGKGIKAIALPDGTEVVPDWLLAIIDVDTLVDDNMSLFTQINKSLGMNVGTVTHSGKSASFYTNIIRI